MSSSCLMVINNVRYQFHVPKNNLRANTCDLFYCSPQNSSPVNYMQNQCNILFKKCVIDFFQHYYEGLNKNIGWCFYLYFYLDLFIICFFNINWNELHKNLEWKFHFMFLLFSCFLN